MTLDAFLQAMVEDPRGAPATWLVLADWLEDQGDPRAELVRLMYQPDYHRDLPGEQRDERVRQLLASGIGPVAPALVNSIGMKLALIPAGTFLMGSPESEAQENEKPQHEVEISRPFLLGACPVTQQEYERQMGNNPSHFCTSGNGENRVKTIDTKLFPVESVSWEEATAFCEALSNRTEEKAAGRLYRLPTEAEWEYACRGGAASYTPFHFGKSLSSIQANFDGDNPFGEAAKGPNLWRTCPVACYPANAFGLFDMHGNVWEWCLDWYDADYYKFSPKANPQGPEIGDRRVLRGGSWLNPGRSCRTTHRVREEPGHGDYISGFRLCCVLDC
jgi:uncharacterized protein (TIGR02996 family)